MHFLYTFFFTQKHRDFRAIKSKISQLVFNLLTLQNSKNICLFIKLTYLRLQERGQNSAVVRCFSLLDCNFQHGQVYTWYILTSGTL